MTETDKIAYVALAVSLDADLEQAWTVVDAVSAEHPDLEPRAFSELVRSAVSHLLYGSHTGGATAG